MFNIVVNGRLAKQGGALDHWNRVIESLEDINDMMGGPFKMQLI